MNGMEPWLARWRSFAQPGTQTLSDNLQSSSYVDAGPSKQWQISRCKGHMRDGVELARLTVRLDARSLSTLALLYLHPLLSTQQVAIVLGVQPPSAERMVRRLHSLGLVQMQTWNDVRHSALSDRGVLLLARCAHLPGGMCAVQANSHHPPHVLRRYQREARSLARTPEHTAGVYSFFTELLQSCAAEREQGHEAGGWQVIRPDGAGECQIDGWRTLFWLEWDRGTMGLRDLRAKFTAYARYVSAQEWRAEGLTALPLLLVVTSSEEQEALIEQALRATFPPTWPCAVYVTIESWLLAPRQGPLAPIWRPFGDRRTPLEHVISPLTCPLRGV
jgi:hypothetical protein